MTTKADATAAQILAPERAALDRWGAGDPDGFLETYDGDVTYFDPLTAARLDGRERGRRAHGMKTLGVVVAALLTTTCTAAGTQRGTPPAGE